jgi:hypothetical protein
MTPPPPAAVVATPRARLVLACVVAFACTLAAGAAIAQADPPSTLPPPTATRPAPATPGNLTREEKRCSAGVRRVDRHKEKLAETKRAHAAHLKVAASCGSARACERAAHREKTLDARERREESQLAKLEAEARNLCAAVVPAPKPR